MLAPKSFECLTLHSISSNLQLSDSVPFALKIKAGDFGWSNNDIILGNKPLKHISQLHLL